MEKYLTYEDESSKKFWRVQTDGNQATVTFERIGTAGQSQTKTYPTSADAEKDAEKQASAKVKKGYSEATPPADSPAPKTAAPAASPAKKAAPKAGTAPAPAADDGQLKPWHSEEGWQYSWYYPGEAVYARLDEPRDEPPFDEDGGSTPNKTVTPKIQAE